MNIKELSVKEQVLLAMQRVYSNALTTTSGGNISAIDERGHIFITPSGIDKGRLTIEDIVEVLPDGKIIGKHAPSMELPFHSNIYRTCKDVKAIVHAHAPAVVAYACMRIIPDSSCARVYEEKLGKIADSRYALPGSLKLGDIVMSKFEEGARTVMMDNHGATVGAADMQSALAKYETLDQLCSTLFNARALGGAVIPKQKTELEKSQYPVCRIDANDKAIRDEICDFIKRAYANKLVGSGWGTLAVRDGNGILFNCEDDSPLDMNSDDVARYQDGKISKDKKCRYLDLIIKIFQKMPQANAIFISMPSAIMGFAVANYKFDARLIPESYLMLKDVQRLDHSIIGDFDALSDKFSTTAPVAIVDNECIITVGKNITKAFDRLEVSDYSARSVIMAKAVAEINPIDDDEVKEIDENFNGW
ncbi:MAG: class II aldolase/adducin family protein [Clostridia bacterium]|nr:class II aldolase/adducin family protein [Clostridia bacterium]